MRSFQNIAKLIKSKRMSHPKGLSQSDLSDLLGYKNGQFISNVERGLCSIPLKMVGKVCQVLGIRQDEMKDAIMKDYDYTIQEHFDEYTKALDAKELSSSGETKKLVGEVNAGPQFTKDNSPMSNVKIS